MKIITPLQHITCDEGKERAKHWLLPSYRHPAPQTAGGASSTGE